MYLIFDTETTGLPKKWDAPISDVDNWPRVVQIAWQLHDEYGELIEHRDFLIAPDDFDIPFDAERVHGISTALAEKDGRPMSEVLASFNEALGKARFVIGQNLSFDLNVMGAEFIRQDVATTLHDLPVLDTCTERTAQLVKIPGGRGGKFKLPTLTELHEFLFDHPFDEAHNATADVEATTRCFLELVRRGEYEWKRLSDDPAFPEHFKKRNPEPFQTWNIKHRNLKKASAKLTEAVADFEDQVTDEERDALEEATVVHLHNYSQFSILQSTSSVQDLVKAAAEQGMPAVAMTDRENMMGAFHFILAANKHNASLDGENGDQPIKPIVGCEFNICEDMGDRTHKDNGYQIPIIAKNKNGYHNLAKLTSLSFTDGFYYVPRIDKKTLLEYKDDLIVLTGNMYGEVASKILNVGEKQAEDALLWWKEHFGEDLYVEVMRHGDEGDIQEDETRAVETLVKLSRKHNLPLLASNNTYYIHKEDAHAHDILLCVKDGEKQSTPKGRGRGYRYGLPNDHYYFKSPLEMKKLFADLPEAILNMQKVVDKIEAYDLARDVLLPKFDIPEEFVDPADEHDDKKRGENNYLRHLTYEGAKKRYGDITPDIKERLDFELETIQNTGYPGYFLIVWDFIKAAREMGVSVGPGRGSAAGSAVAYCLWITNIDPIHYDLLFERFLNPDRVSMPDIDIDFDDENRGKVLDYVIDKYGADQVAQIITYGTMAAKSSIRDTARVLDLPLPDSDRIAKLIPDFTSLSKIFSVETKDVASKFKSDADQIHELHRIADGDDLAAQTVKQAQILEGCVRNLGVHACGVIITPDKLTKFVPVATAKNSELYVTQFDNEVVESAGLLKMDFLGLKTLSQIKDTLAIIEERTGEKIDIESISLEDEKTFELFQRGDTVGIFQYESPGMQKHMRELKPTAFADLIAMNALYRPGPMEYIPDFVDRKHGRKEITYDLPAMEEYLEETYGITVYQEQVMLLSQKLANFSKGDADVLRKAMGKKKMDVLMKMKPRFLDQGEANGHDREILEKIWKDWEAFASYAFNKSHSTCYAWIAYQTAYLKANYPAEFMAATLSNNMNNLKDVTKFMDECKRAGIEVLGPDVNESNYKFTVNDQGAIRFGMGGIKGLGHPAVQTIIKNRKEKPYTSIFDMAKRIDLRAANRKSFEALALSGGFDGLDGENRAQYFYETESGVSFLDQVIKFAQRHQQNENSAQVSLFGESSDVQIPEPSLPECEPWGTMEKLRREKEVVGIYISGHPLDDYKKEKEYFCNADLSRLKDLESLVGKELKLCGVITNVEHRVSRANKPWGFFTMEDYDDSYEFRLFGEDYLKFRHFLIPNNFVYTKIGIQQGYIDRNTGRQREPRINFKQMQQLHDVMDEYAKKIVVRFKIDDIEEDAVQGLKKAVQEHPGDQRILFEIKDGNERISLNMHSKTDKVKVNSELLTVLDGLGINYRVK